MTVIGINPAHLRGTLPRARGFVSQFSLTFPNLLDDSNAVFQHYDSPYNSHYWLLYRNGTRIGDAPRSFSVADATRQLRSLGLWQTNP